jgi:hypothetical protein
MAQTTEAACLLQTGAMYPRRLGLKTTDGMDLFVGVKVGGVSIYFGDAPIYHFDLDGRWQRAFIDGMHYLKGIDAAVQSIDRERDDGGMVLRRETLPLGRTFDLDASIRAMALDLIDDLDSGRLEILPTPEKALPFEVEDLRGFLERVGDWDTTAWFAHRERYLGTYGPMPFLPPDCPRPLVLQATLGNAQDRAFGRTQPARHYVRSRPEFEEHVRAVTRLIGRRITQFSTIFLAGADVLHLAPDLLAGYLEIIRRNLPLGHEPSVSGEGWDSFPVGFRSIHVFLDDLAPPLPDPQLWHALSNALLTHVSIGIESGDPSIRAIYGKNWENDALAAIVGEIHRAGIGVSLVVLAGAGGRMDSGSHLEKTLTLLDSLPLWPKDLMTLIDARSLDQAPPEGFEPLSDEEVAGQIADFKSRIGRGRPSKAPRVVVYNPDKQAR